MLPLGAKRAPGVDQPLRLEHLCQLRLPNSGMSAQFGTRGRHGNGMRLILQRTRFCPLFLGALVVVMALASCRASVSVSVSDGKVEPEAEAHYREVAKRGSAAMATASRGFESGVCNVGGDQRGCHGASAQAIEAIGDFLRDLDATSVPSRYREGDGAVRAALKLMRDGFERRNQGLATGNDADFVAGNDMLKLAEPQLRSAYEKFPADARP